MTQKSITDSSSDVEKEINKDRALYLFSPDNNFRKFMKLIEKYEFQGINLLNATIYIAIGISSVLPCFQSPLYDMTTTFQKVLE